MIRRPPRSTLFPTRRSSDLRHVLRESPLVGRNVDKLGDLAEIHQAPENLEGHDRRRPHGAALQERSRASGPREDRKSTRLNSSHTVISYAVFCLRKTTP